MGEAATEGGDWWGVGFPRTQYFVSKESALVWEGQVLSARITTSLSSDLYLEHFP